MFIYYEISEITIGSAKLSSLIECLILSLTSILTSILNSSIHVNEVLTSHAGFGLFYNNTDDSQTQINKVQVLNDSTSKPNINLEPK